MSDTITRSYSNGEIEVVWRAGRCIHSTVCFRGLPRVFDPRRRPWVDVAGATTEEIVRQASACPSGALTYLRAGADPIDAAPLSATVGEPTRVEPVPDGPLRVRGAIEVLLPGGPARREGVTAFCRCGASANKPFCDGSHGRVGFRG